MKTVQLLYSYLLVEKPFTLESQPSSPTKEKRFAYNLYLNLIYLVDRLAHQIVGKNKSLPLISTRFVVRTENDERIAAIKSKEEGNYPFAPIEPELRDAIKESLIFREFEKNRSEGLLTENLWEDLFKAVILPNPSLNKIIQTLPDYSLSGTDRMKEMLDTTFKNFYSSQDNGDEAIHTLKRSLKEARDLYMLLLDLPVELTEHRKDQLIRNRRKLLVKESDLNPNMRFVDNRIPELIEKNEEFSNYIEKNHLSWKVEDPELLDILMKAILESDIYKVYESGEKPDINADSEFWRNIFLDVILNNRYFLEYLENKSVFWNDDLEIMASFVLKTFKKLENPKTESEAVLPMYKDGDSGKDASFGEELFRYVLANKDIYRKYIQDALSKDKWEADRLAFMDIVIVMTALAEIINYPEIPLAVSVNEYLEIAKSYSSAKSSQFINGLLASILPKLKEEGVIMK